MEEHSNKQRTPYLFTAKELDEETQLYYFGARYYDPRVSVWVSADPILGKYLGADPSKLSGMGGAFNSKNLGLYTYSHSNPVAMLDPDGNETWFIGGAGVDGGYIDGMANALSSAGVTNVRTATPKFASTGNMYSDAATIVARNHDRGGYYSRYKGRVSLNIPEGEQLNFIGYSHGSIVAAQTALAIAEGGQKVDNVALIGAPINQDLLDALQNHDNIGNVIVKDLTDKGDPIYAGMSDAEIIKSAPKLMSQMAKEKGHFYYAGDNAGGQSRRVELANDLKDQGIE